VYGLARIKELRVSHLERVIVAATMHEFMHWLSFLFVESSC
jgi:hypothetical protein